MTEDLKLDICPTCGYSLTGLPADGTCPECGNVYDSSQIVFYGWACGQHANPSNSRRGALVLALIPFLALFQLADPGVPRHWRFVLLGIWIIMLAFPLIRRRQTDHPGGIQIRMDETGIVQFDDLAKLRSQPVTGNAGFTPWNRLKIDKWQSRGTNRYRIRLKVFYLWYKPVSQAYPVDAEIECSAERAAQLRRIIRSWGVG